MMPRIAYVTSQFPFGRREAFLQAESRALAALADLTVFAVRPAASRAVVPCAAPSIAIRYRSARSARGAARTLLRRPLTCAQLGARLLTAPYGARAKLRNLFVFGKGLALADELRVRSIETVHAHWLTTSSTVALVAAHLNALPLSISAHRFDLYADNFVAGKAAAARAIRVISERGAADVRAQVAPDLRERIHVIHLGVDVPAHAARRSAADGPLRIASVGNLLPVKGHADLIAAVARLRDMGVEVRCTINGDGPLRGHLARQIEHLAVGSLVTLRGFVPHRTILAELGAGNVDVLVHPSIERGHLHEGIPVAMMEAMACGVPCVATQTGSIDELVDASCGILVAQRDPGALAAALRSLAGDRARRHALGDAARARIRERFDIVANTRRLFDLIVTGDPGAQAPSTSFEEWEGRGAVGPGT